MGERAEEERVKREKERDKRPETRGKRKGKQGIVNCELRIVLLLYVLIPDQSSL
jgi:hypothetical protein